MIATSDKYYYDQKSADRVIKFIEKFITHVKGELAKTPLKLKKWQKDDIIRPLFGMRRKDNGYRRYRTCYVEIPRKNSKSTMGAAIALYLLLSDDEKGAEIYSVAGDREQAHIIFDIAKSMVTQNKKLSEHSELFQYVIKKKGALNYYKVISAEAKTKHGFNAHGVIFDELHVQPNRELWDVMTTAQGARTQPLTIAFTTAGYDKDSICYEIHEYARKVKEGIINDETFLPVIYNADPDDDIYALKTWKKANPGFETIIKEAYLRQQVNRIKNEPSFESTFRRLHLNQWVGTAETWIDDVTWMQGSIPVNVDEGSLCYAGLDLASTRDITAFVMIFPEDDRIKVIPYFFIPENNVSARSQKENIHYEQWIREGYMIATPGNVTDYEFIKQKIRELSHLYRIAVIGYDRWNSSQLVIGLQDEGFNMSPFGQGYASMSAPTKELERMAMKGLIQHAGNPVLRWMNSNVQIETDPAGNIKINKKRSREKVDGMVALVMSIGEWMTDTMPMKSIFEDEDYDIPVI
ncbi:MAG: terminase TerL endonuclease subunit [Candidatus Paceibacterota bacterium]